MNTERIDSIVDLQALDAEFDHVLTNLKGMDDLIKQSRQIKIDFTNADGSAAFRKGLQDIESIQNDLIATQKKLATSMQEIARLENLITEARTNNNKRTRESADEYTKLTQAYRDALRESKNMAIQYGVESEEAKKAAQAAEEYRQKLQEVNEFAKSGGKVESPFDPNTIPFISNLDELQKEAEAAQKTGTVVNELEQAEAQAANAATAMGNSNIQAADTQKVLNETLAGTGVSIEQIALKYDEYTGTLQQNVQLQLENAQALEANKAAQKELEASQDVDIERMAQLKLEELQLMQANKDLGATIREQIKEFQAADGSIDQLQAQLTLLKQSYEQLSTEQKATPFGLNLKKEIDALTPSVVQAEKSIGNSQRLVGSYADAIQNAGGKILNFIQRDLLRSIAGFFVFNLAFQGIQKLIEWLQKLSPAEQLAADRLKAMTDNMQELNNSVYSTSSAYGDALKNVDQLNENVKLAKEGFIEKDKVVKEYNDTMGKVTGQVKSFNEVEDKLVKDGAAYIQMMFNMAMANAYLQEAVKKSVEAEKNRPRLEQRANARPIEHFGAGQEEAIRKGREQAQQQLDFQKQDQQQSLDLYKQYQEKAAQIARQMHFNMFPDQKTKKGKQFDATSEELKAEQELVKAKGELRKLELEEEMKYLQQYSEDERNSLFSRLAAYKKYTDDKKQVAGIEENTEVQAIQVKLDKITEIEKKGASQRTNEEKKLLIDKQALLAEKEVAEQKYALKIVEINQEAAKKIHDIYSKNNETLYKGLLGEIDNEKIDAEVQALQKETKAYDDLNKKVKEGKVAFEDYEEQRKNIADQANIERLQADEDSLKQKIALNKELGKNTESMEQELLNVHNRLEDLKLKKTMDNLKKTLDAEKAATQQKKSNEQQLYSEIETIGKNLVDGVYQKHLSAIQKQIDANNAWKDAEINRINNSTLSEQDKAARIAQINAQAQAQQDQLDKKKRDTQMKQAKFERDIQALQIGIQTAAAVFKLTTRASEAKAEGSFLLSNPVTAAYAPVAFAAAATILSSIPSTIAAGAAEIGAIMSKGLPSFAKGTSNSPEGWALTDEGGGPELYVKRSGEMFMGNDRPTLRYLERGTKVIPYETWTAAANNVSITGLLDNIKEPVINVSTGKEIGELKTLMRWQTTELKKAYKTKPKIIVQNKIDVRNSEWFRRNILE